MGQLSRGFSRERNPEKNKGSCGLGWSRAQQGMGAAGSTPPGWGCCCKSQYVVEKWGARVGEKHHSQGGGGLAWELEGRERAEGPRMH